MALQVQRLDDPLARCVYKDGPATFYVYRESETPTIGKTLCQVHTRLLIGDDRFYALFPERLPSKEEAAAFAGTLSDASAIVEAATARFDGTTYEPVEDQERLAGQLQRVYEWLQDGEWWTLEQIRCGLEAKHATHDTEAAISARLRDLRKERFGHWKVERRRVAGKNGLFEYRLNGRQPRQEKRDG